MPLEPKEVQAFEDMIRYGTDAIGYVQGLDFEGFVADHRTQHATMYAIATVAEASRRIPDARHEEWSDIPWPMIRGMRNILMHEYGRVDLPTVYRVATVDLPKLMERLREILAQSGE